MENFAEFMMNETNYMRKIEIAYYLYKTKKMFFDNSVICRTELARRFITTMNLDVDENLIITACLLYSCKKVKVAKNFEQIKYYAKDGAKYLQELGFDERFCRICEGVNRYSGITPREPESDILEIVDNFSGLMLNREDRVSYGVQQALELLVNKNLRDTDNIYLEKFKEFIYREEGVRI
jgi:hypothetical protein